MPVPIRGGESVQGKDPPMPHDPTWDRLLDVERRLEAEIAAAEADASSRVAQARAACLSAAPDPQALAALAAAQEHADLERQRSELERIAADADAAVRTLATAPDALIDTLARVALDAAITGDETAVPR
jgi:hypothetical protein